MRDIFWFVVWIALIVTAARYGIAIATVVV